MMQRYNRFLYGFLPGLILPVVFMWLYLSKFYPDDIAFFEILARLYPGVMLGKLLLLSSIPNLGFVFMFYKSDSFKIATGVLIGAMPYFIAALIMM